MIVLFFLGVVISSLLSSMLLLSLVFAPVSSTLGGSFLLFPSSCNCEAAHSRLS